MMKSNLELITYYMICTFLSSSVSCDQASEELCLFLSLWYNHSTHAAKNEHKICS